MLFKMTQDNNELTVFFIVCYSSCLQSAKQCIDLCIYTITCSDLADVIVKLSELGVQVRVITDSEQQDAAGSQVGQFRLAGWFDFPFKVQNASIVYLLYRYYTLSEKKSTVFSTNLWPDHKNFLR